MEGKWKKYRSLAFAAVLVPIIAVLLAWCGVLLIDPSEVLANVAILSIWVIILSLLFYRIDHSGRRMQLIVGGVVLILSLVLIIMLDHRMDMTDNPVTLCASVIFWVYIAYLLSPNFVVKYRLLFLAIYGPACAFFVYIRLFNPDYLAMREQIIPIFFLSVPLFMLVWVYEQWKWFQTLKADKAQAELALLKSQINPHFFFNTLNNLYSLAVNKSNQAPAVILKLSEMMRYTIYEGQKEWVSLEEELVYLQNFIQLHEIRHQKEVDVLWEEETITGLKVAPLLFINLVENAFKHGAEQLTTAAYIHIKIKANLEQIDFSIQNNYDPAERAAEQGIGLQNLRKRLALLYPKSHELEIDDQDGCYSCTLNIRPLL